jgi:apolipoprotein N-acyltransferase
VIVGARARALAHLFAARLWLRLLCAFVFGALLACAFAPLSWWPLAILCPAVLMLLWSGATPRRAAQLGFCFSAGTFAAGTYWLYTSIHGFGQAPIWVAVGLMLALVGIMAIYQAFVGWCVARFLPPSGLVRTLVGVPALWVFVEWWRGWFLSGFAWLSLGYSLPDTWLAGFAPLVGVYGLSALLLLSAGALVTLIEGTRAARVVALLVLVAPWPCGWALQQVAWTHAVGKPVGVAIIQGAVPQDEKWQEDNHDATLLRYRNLTIKALGTPLIIWPEAAPPDLANNLVDYLGTLYRMASARSSSIVLGVVRASDDGEQYFNSVLSLDAQGPHWYDKSHLVPFAEFFPVPSFVRAWLRLRNLPYEDFTRGATVQPPLPAAGLRLATNICYEDAFGTAQLPVLGESDALVNVTNDAWFGHSSARHQHFQIARMRAIEAGRYLVRAANDGISAVVGPHGEVIARAPEFKPYVLRAAIVARAGLPPYAYVGNYPVLLLALAGVAASIFAALRQRRVEIRGSRS